MYQYAKELDQKSSEEELRSRAKIMIDVSHILTFYYKIYPQNFSKLLHNVLVQCLPLKCES